MKRLFARAAPGATAPGATAPGATALGAAALGVAGLMLWASPLLAAELPQGNVYRPGSHVVVRLEAAGRVETPGVAVIADRPGLVKVPMPRASDALVWQPQAGQPIRLPLRQAEPGEAIAPAGFPDDGPSLGLPLPSAMSPWITTPVSGWRPTRDAATRWGVFAIAAIYALVIAGAWLLLRRFRASAVAVATLVAAALLLAWRSTLPVAAVRWGEVIVVAPDGQSAIRDRLVFLQGYRPGRVTVDLPAAAWLFDPRSAALASADPVEIRISPADQAVAEWSIPVTPGGATALLVRERVSSVDGVVPGKRIAVAPGDTLMRLIRPAYLRAGDSVASLAPSRGDSEGGSSTGDSAGVSLGVVLVERGGGS